jgi:hypothetical protein
MTIGGRGFAAVESGTTITVLRARLIGVALTITQGRFLLIYYPRVGFRSTQYTSPRFIARTPYHLVYIVFDHWLSLEQESFFFA